MVNNGGIRRFRGGEGVDPAVFVPISGDGDGEMS